MNTIRTAALFLATTVLVAPVQAQDIDLEDSDNRIGYSVGVNIARNLSNQGLADNINVDAFVQGLRDQLSDDVQLSQEQMQTALADFQQQMMQQQQQQAQQAQQEGQTFLEENAQRDEVMTTDSGLQYQVLESGDESGATPSESDSVLAHYEGRLIDGEVFDSSRERGEPAQFRLDQVIPGWTEGLQMMRPGDRWRLFIPADLAYGESGSGPIPPNSTLIFDVELLEVNPGGGNGQ